MKKQKSKVFGILNVTPDSFSEDGKNCNHSDALSSVQEMICYGVDVIDVGGESTRPGAVSISIEEEIKRLSILPQISALAKESSIQVSMDSRNYDTIKTYIDYIDIINDQSGFADERIQYLALQHNKKALFMHSLSLPVKKGEFIQDPDIVGYLKNWLREKIALLENKGFKKDQLIFDPGIGFGTTTKQSIEILKNLSSFQEFDVPMLIGHSRKSFLAQFGEADAAKRDLETHAVTFYLASKGVDYLRVHDVYATKRILKMAELFF